MFGFLLIGESAEKAKTLAKEQLGSNYQYHISSMQASGDKGSAVVTAFNEDEIQNIQVEW